MVTKATRYAIVGGLVCLDFANSLDGARGGRTHEHLHAYADLVEWARQAEVLTTSEARRLTGDGKERPAAAQRVLRRALSLREAIYGAVTSAAEGRRPRAEDLDVINAELERALGRARLIAGREGIRHGWPSLTDELDGVLRPLVRSAAELLVSPDVGRVHVCGSERCTWLFLDTTRNGRRRWCEMKTCGNLAKVRAFRRRRAGGTGRSAG